MFFFGSSGMKTENATFDFFFSDQTLVPISAVVGFIRITTTQSNRMALLRRSSLIDLVQDLSTRWRSDLGFCAFKVETDCFVSFNFRFLVDECDSSAKSFQNTTKNTLDQLTPQFNCSPLHKTGAKQVNGTYLVLTCRLHHSDPKPYQ